MCEQSLVTHPFHPFCCKYWGARARPHRAVQCTLRRLIEQAGDHADMEHHVPELYDWVRNSNEAAPTMRCAVLDVVSWFLGVLQQLWMDVSARCPHAERYNEIASIPGGATVAGEAEKTKRCGMAVRALVFETFGRLGGKGAKLLRDLVTTAAANGQCSPHAVCSWSECCCLHKQTHTCERWDPESQNDLLLSLLCCWQSGACTDRKLSRSSTAWMSSWV